MSRLSAIKKKNSGSTLVFVIVALLFIGLLASLILALSAASFKMRNIDYAGKRNFYEGEEYTTRIYNEVGMNAIGVLGESYVSMMSKLQSNDIRSQKELNDSLKESYFRHVLKYLKLVDLSTKDDIMVDTYSFIAGDPKIAELEALLLGYAIKDQTDLEKDIKLYINDPDSVADDNYIKVQADLKGKVDEEGEYYPVITINDIHLQYTDNKTGYESFYTFDLVVSYPDWDFTFANPKAASTDIDTFLDYVLINSGKLTFDGGNRSVVGCVSTGSNHLIASNEDTTGLHITEGTNTSFSANGNNRYEKGAIVVTDNIYINGSTISEGKMSVTNARVWCNSIILRREDDRKGFGPVYDASGVKHYVQDDLQIDGAFAKADIDGGSYFGFSSNRETDVQNAFNSSSAIIVNGYDSKITMNNLTKLYVNGLAYLRTRTKSYRTGESLAVKGNQDAYLVPNAYMGAAGSNPVRTANAVLDTVVEAELRASDFFGKKWLLPGDEVTTLSYTDNNNRSYTFYYLNFVSYEAEREYVEYVLNTNPGTNTILKDMQDQIKQNMANMHMVRGTEDDVILELTNTTDGFTAGAIINAKGGTVYGQASAATIAGVTLDSISIRNRYLLMKSLLLPVVGGSIDGSEPQVLNLGAVPSEDLQYKIDHHFPEADGLSSNERAVMNQQLNNSAVENIINLSLLRQYTVSEPHGIWQRSHTISAGSATITYVTPMSDGRSSDNTISVKDGVVHVTHNYTGVLVVDGPVVIENVSVNGLIVATGEITVAGNSASAASYTLSSNPELVDELMKKEQNKDDYDNCAGHSSIDAGDRRSNVFKFYPIETPKTAYGDAIKAIKNSDVISVDNWRKYEDARSYGEVE